MDGTGYAMDMMPFYQLRNVIMEMTIRPEVLN